MAKLIKKIDPRPSFVPASTDKSLTISLSRYVDSLVFVVAMSKPWNSLS